MPHLVAHSREDEQKGDEDSDEDNADDDGGDVASNGRPVAVVVERGPSIRTERVEPALHVGTSPNRAVTRCKTEHRGSRAAQDNLKLRRELKLPTLSEVFRAYLVKEFQMTLWSKMRVKAQATTS